MRELSKGKLYINSRDIIWTKGPGSKGMFFLALQHSFPLLEPVKNILFIMYFNLHYLFYDSKSNSEK